MNLRLRGGVPPVAFTADLLQPGRELPHAEALNTSFRMIDERLQQVGVALAQLAARMQTVEDRQGNLKDDSTRRIDHAQSQVATLDGQLREMMAGTGRFAELVEFHLNQLREQAGTANTKDDRDWCR